MPIHVVVCDSQPDVARMISCRLMRADFEVHSAHDADSAWDVVQRVHPQLLITHLQPSGIKLVRRIRNSEDTRELTVIGLSATFRPSPAVQRLRQQLQLSALLQKPFSLRQLVALAGKVTQSVVPAA